MATATATLPTIEAIKDRVTPALESFEETVRKGRHALTRGQHAAEDAAAATALRIRKRPLTAVMIAAGAGALLGALIGFGVGWKARK